MNSSKTNEQQRCKRKSVRRESSTM